MTLSTEMIEYIHIHNLTCDPAWTFDFAEELVQVISIAFKIEPPSLSLSEEIEQTWSSSKHVPSKTGSSQNWKFESIINESWLFPKERLSYAKSFCDSIKQGKHLDIADLNWWYDEPFEPQIVHISDDFLVQRRRTDPKSSFEPAEFRKIKGYFCGSDEQTSIQALINEEPVQIPRPEDLSDTTLRLTPSQYHIMRDLKIGSAKIVRASTDMNIDILADENESTEPPCRTISPPLISRVTSTLQQSWHRNAQELVCSVMNPVEVENIHGFSPGPSNDTWNAIDGFQCLLFTPPSSPLPLEINISPEIHCDFLSPSALPDDAHGLENPFETVLFSRTDGMTIDLDRSRSFNPRNHLDAASFLFDGHQAARISASTEPASDGSDQEINPIPFSVMKDLVGNKEWDDKHFEHEIFGSPGDAVNPDSPLKKIPINLPASPQRNHGIDEEMNSFRNKHIQSREPNKPWLQHFSVMSQDLNKVEGLRALNIELKWNAYNFEPSSTIENLTNLDFKPFDEAISEVSSNRDAYSVVSKRLKTNHDFQGLEEQVTKLSEFLDQTTNRSYSRTASSEVDRSTLNELGAIKVGSVSGSHSSETSSSSNPRMTLLPSRESLKEIEENYQSRNLHSDLTEESESERECTDSEARDKPSYNEFLSVPEDDEAFEFLVLNSSQSILV